MEEDVYVFPLSLPQQRLWFLHQLVPGNSAYNLDLAVTLQGALDAGALERSLQTVVARHEVLRTTFAEIDGTAVQVVAAASVIALQHVDLSHLPPAAAEQEARVVAANAGETPFDLTKGPLLRATLVRLTADTHVLILAMHHIVTDGWSMGVLFDELTTAYGYEVGAGRLTLPALPLQYADFAVWQREWVSGARLDSAREYWREALAELPRLELSTDRPRPSVKSGRGASVPFELPPALSQAVRDLARREGVTLFMTFLAAFGTLLGRYSGHTDLAIGSPIANRTRAELERMIGFFVNTLVLRVSLDDAPSFRRLLRRVKTIALDAYAHQDLPFERVVEELQPQRDLSRNPLFEVAFQCESASGKSLQLPGLRVSAFSRPNATAKFDLSLGIWDFSDGIAGQFEYSTDLFERATIERMAGHFATLLETAVTEPDRSIHGLPLLTASERQQMLVDWNATSATVPEEAVPALIERQAALNPHAVAVQSADVTMTYGELIERANRVARPLRARSIGSGSLVALCLDRSIDLVVGMLAVWKAGGAYLPLDPTAPVARHAAIFADAEPALVLTRAMLDAFAAEIDSETTIDATIDQDSLAYVIYTSGSSGTPKGVEVTHRSLTNLVAWHAATYELTPSDRGSQIAALDFDATVWEIWPYLAQGASVHLAPDAARASPELLLEWFVSARITMAFIPTPLLEAMLECRLPHGLALRAVLTGGDLLHTGPARALPFALFNHYGPTENTVVATASRVNHGSTVTPPIGRPIANVEAYVLDAAGEPVPIGVPGELHLGGAGLARGYRHRPALTAARFRPHPFRPAPARLYATGDRVRYRRDGQLEFLGRLDEQIKLHGFRIEPGEIEAAVRRHPAVAEVCVVRREDTPGVPRLVAYAVARDGEAPPVEAVQALVREQVPAYMVPAAYVWLARLPLTAHGKVDRAALPAPTSERPLSTRAVAPRTALERLIAGVWREVLQVDSVGRDDNFFDLGGRSLLLVRVHTLLRDRVAAPLTVLDLFRYPTIRALAAHLDSAIDRPGPRDNPLTAQHAAMAGAENRRE